MCLKMRALVLFAALSYIHTKVSTAHTAHLEARVVLSKDTLGKILNAPEPATVHLDVVLPPELLKNLGLREDDKKFRSVGKNVTETWYRDLRSVPYIVEYLIQSSRELFKSIIRTFYSSFVQDSEDLIPEVDVINSVYKSSLHKHIKQLLQYDPLAQVEKDTILLDIIETSSTLTYKGAIKCLQFLEEKQSNKSIANTKMNADEIFKMNLKKKTKDFNFICEKINLCRPFPGFSDYLADLFGETIKLPDSKMHTLIMKTIVAVNKKNDEITKVLGKRLVINLEKYLQNVIYGDLNTLRTALSENRNNILQRYTWMSVSQKILAIRALLDMIDKAFTLGGSDRLNEHLTIIIKGVRYWNDGEDVDIENIMVIFLKYVTETLTKYWLNGPENEVRMLVDIIIKGRTDEYNRYLLTNGSNFVNN